MRKNVKSAKATVADAVKEVLSHYPYMNEFLASKCANFSAVAEKITPEVKKLVGKDKINKQAVLVSVIRHSQSLGLRQPSKIILKSLAESTITLKTDVDYLNIPKTLHNLKVLELLYSRIKWDKGEVLFIVQGVGEVSVAIDKSNYPLLKEGLGGQSIERPFPATAVVVVNSPPEASTEGFIHFITGPIAEAGINIEMLTMTRDTIFLVNEKNAARLFEVLKRLIDGCRRLT